MTLGTMNGAVAVPERMTGARGPRPGEPLWIVHGPGTTDLVVGHDLRVRPVEEMVWEVLHDAGYRRIVISDFREPVRFLDPDSRDLTRGTRTAAVAPRTRQMRRFSGPLGRDLVLRAAPTPAPEPRGAADPQRIMMLDGLMRRDDVPTAVVVLGVETLLTHLEPAVQRSLAEMLWRWTSGGAADGNTCVLLFARPDFTDVVEFVRAQRYLPQLADHLAGFSRRRSATVVAQLGHAEEAELGRLVQVVRLRARLTIGDWKGLPYLVRLMAAQALPVRAWLRELAVLADKATALTPAALRKRGLAEVPVHDVADVWSRLDAMVGMDGVRAFLQGLRSTLQAEAALRAAGHAGTDDPPSLHLVFTGNPGTGKTLVAGLVGELYRELGLLRRGHLVDGSVKNLVSPNVGDTAVQTAARVREALDGVLFVDEAYRLSDQRDGFGNEAIDVLLEEMENHRDRLVVIVAGYPDRMAAFLASNPGLSSRFPLANRLEFRDFTPDELHRIVMDRLADEGIPVAPDLDEALRTITATMFRNRSNTFGNARDMREMAAEVKREWARRTSPVPGEPLPAATEADVPDRHRSLLGRTAPIEEVLADLDSMIGLDGVKTAIRDLAGVMELRSLRPGRAGAVVAPHMLFLGPPGTGKTTVAEHMGRVLVALGLLVKGHVVTVTRSGLVAQYVGQTAPLTRAKVAEALDGVLFIDEAYQLVQRGQNDFGSEAVTELTEQMERWRGRLVVIAAGYPAEMEAFVRSNAGLTSRFTTRIDFPDFTVPELRRIFESMVAAEGLSAGPGVGAKAVRWLEDCRASDGDRFGNARTVRTLLGIVEKRMARRIRRLPVERRPSRATEILPVDVPGPGES